MAADRVRTGGSRRIAFGRRRDADSPVASGVDSPDSPDSGGVSSAGSRRVGSRRAGSRAVGAVDAGTEPVRVGTATGVTAVPGTKKGRPTPKRREAERRRGGPVAPPPTSRREASKRLRAQQAQDRRAGTGRDGAAMLQQRDAGPARAAVRDIIDSRRNVAVLMLPCALLLFIATASKNPSALAVLSRLWVATLLAVAIDVVLITLSVRRRLRAVPEATGSRGHVLYGLMRSTVLRRWRMPKPQVAPPRLFGSR